MKSLNNNRIQIPENVNNRYGKRHKNKAFHHKRDCQNLNEYKRYQVPEFGPPGLIIEIRNSATGAIEIFLAIFHDTPISQEQDVPEVLYT